MSDLISRQAAIELLKSRVDVATGIYGDLGGAVHGATLLIMDLPAADVRENVRGDWIPQNHNKTNGMLSTLVYYYPKCSVCGHCANYTNFCPNCGADMRG